MFDQTGCQKGDSIRGNDGQVCWLPMPYLHCVHRTKNQSSKENGRCPHARNNMTAISTISQRTRSTYRHGDLRRVLLEAGIELARHARAHRLAVTGFAFDATARLMLAWVKAGERHSLTGIAEALGLGVKRQQDGNGALAQALHAGSGRRSAPWCGSGC